MTSFNRERNSGVEQGSNRVNTTDGQSMESVFDSQGNLIGYRPVINAPAQPMQESSPIYDADPLAQLPDDFFDRARRGLEIMGQQLQEQEMGVQRARDLEAFHLAARMSSTSAPPSAQYAPAMPVQKPQAMFTPAPTHEVPTAAPNKPKKSSGPVPFFDLNDPINRHITGADKNTGHKIADKPTKEKGPFWTKRKRAVGAGVLALGVLSGGSVLAVQNLTGGSHDAAVIDEKNAPAPVNPDLIPALTYTPLVEAFGGCIDENGGGPALGSVTTKSETRTKWKTGMTGANGGELTLETRDPVTKIESASKIQLESTADYTACVVAANVANVVSLDLTNPEAPKAKVNLPNIDPQIRSKVTSIIDRGWSSAEFETPLIPAEGVVASGVEAKKIPADVAANFTAAYNDVPNAAVEAQAALNATTDTLATEGSVYSEQIKVVIKQKIETTIKEKVKRLAQDNLTKAKSISIEWVGELKGILAKKQPVPVANKVTVDTKSLIKDFVANPTPASNQAK